MVLQGVRHISKTKASPRQSYSILYMYNNLEINICCVIDDAQMLDIVIENMTSRLCFIRANQRSQIIYP